MRSERESGRNWTMIIVATSLMVCRSSPAWCQSPATPSREPHSPPSVSAINLQRVPAEVEQAIRWLPEDAESIVMARGPLQEGVLNDFRVRHPRRLQASRLHNRPV